jgi:Carboxypeptidase regulatory-like domain/TonB-dependent Receptor Plug Domain
MCKSHTCARQAAFRSFVFLPGIALLILLAFPLITFGQAGDASISGLVSDPAGRLVYQAEVTIKNVVTNVAKVTVTNQAGIYTFPSLPPGDYVLTVQKQGFRSVDLVGLTLYTQDRLERNFTLSIGSASESVTVSGGTTNESPAVSLTVDREFVEDMPLNGRSFQDLIQLTPGAVIDNSGDGAYSINGQRSDSNIYTVDGVSANLSGYLSSGYALGGNVPATTALGTTQSLASIDSLQEFTIQTSGYTAEYGRSPGGQVQFTTRSGTNNVHGTLFDYFRNTDLDANSYSNNYHNDPRTAEHQNDFGGTLGGPLIIPHAYNGKDRTFFFASYEGLRLLLPSSETEYNPTQAFINAVSPNVQPFLSVKSLPNTSTSGDSCTVAGSTIDISGSAGPGATPCDEQFYYAYSYLNNLDNYSLRVDHNLSSRFHAFLRYADTPSSLVPGAEEVETEAVNVHSWTAGLTSNLRTNLLDDFRFNYTRDGQEEVESSRALKGAVPLPRSLLIPAQYENTYDEAEAIMEIPGTKLEAVSEDFGANTVQNQYQLVDSLAWTRGKHNLKLGGDWRRLKTGFSADPYGDILLSTSLAALQSGYATTEVVLTTTPGEPAFQNLSVYAQDHWKVSSRLSIDYGLRWEFNPTPGPVDGEYPAVLNSSNISTATVAPLGTPPYKTLYDKFAPRFGFAWNAIPSHRYAVTVRGGVGIFYDTGQTISADQYQAGYPFFQSVTNSGNIPLPLSSAAMAPPPSVTTLSPPYGFLENMTSQDLTLPYTEQWNLSFDEALNQRNTLTVSYVGNNGRKLLFNQEFAGAPYGNTNFPGGIEFTSNAAQSSYNALQVQDIGKIFTGLDIVGSFTYAHALDNDSTDSGTFAPIWGNSDNDLRRILNVALNYQTPTAQWDHLLRAVTSGWLLANRFAAQSGYPTNLAQDNAALPDGIEATYYPDLVPGVPIYLHGSAAVNPTTGAPAPGGWMLNRNAFACVPTNGTTPCVGTPTENGDLGRNYVRLPSFWALNTAVQRDFPLYEQLHLNFRAEAFNILNHPNLTSPNTSLTSSTFGELISANITTMGTHNSLYAMGAARSLQLSLRLSF